MKFSNPSIEDINEWAFFGQEWPHQEWDLFLSWTREIDLFIALATDPKCPHQSFFLHMLYYTVGATFTSTRTDDDLALIAFFVEKGRKVKHGDIRKWVNAVDLLLQGTMHYDYHDWRGGRLANFRFT